MDDRVKRERTWATFAAVLVVSLLAGISFWVWRAETASVQRHRAKVAACHAVPPAAIALCIRDA